MNRFGPRPTISGGITAATTTGSRECRPSRRPRGRDASTARPDGDSPLRRMRAIRAGERRGPAAGAAGERRVEVELAGLHQRFGVDVRRRAATTPSSQARSRSSCRRRPSIQTAGWNQNSVSATRSQRGDDVVAAAHVTQLVREHRRHLLVGEPIRDPARPQHHRPHAAGHARSDRLLGQRERHVREDAGSLCCTRRKTSSSRPDLGRCGRADDRRSRIHRTAQRAISSGRTPAQPDRDRPRSSPCRATIPPNGDAARLPGWRSAPA